MREYHVDTHPSLLEKFVNPEDVQYGGSLSVRKPPGARPVIFVGQDESVFHQYSFPKKQWMGPKGNHLILPKGEGEGEMGVGFQACEFGLGLFLTDCQRQQINANQEKTNYISKWEAKVINGNSLKPPTSQDENPTLKFFRLGVNHDGYWTGSHMKLLVEDVVDCLIVVYPQFDFLFLFD